MSGPEAKAAATQRNIYVAGEFSNQEDWNDLISRLCWYFTPYLDQINTVSICANQEQLEHVQALDSMDPMIAEALPALREKLRPVSADRLRERLQTVDPTVHVFLLADDRLQEEYTPLVHRFREKGHFYRIDSRRVRMEGSFFLWAGLNVFVDTAAETAAFHDRFRAMARDLGQFDKAYIFGTGPSLSDFVEGHDFSDGLTIMANSMVLNQELLTALKPRLIVAGDPIFHAGCSRYAAAFRRELAHAMEQSGAWFLCPLRDVRIYQTYLPEALRERVIGVPFDAKAPQSMDLQQDFRLKPYPNILTLMLLPLAATFARNIHVAGCDGRSLTENSGFWQHDKKAQFNDEMDNIKQIHSGFFAIDYNNYYFDHARDLEGVLLSVEEGGVRVVMETPSFLPALNMREKAGLRASEASPDRAFRPQSLAILDPDARGEWGHFLAYDRRLGQAAVAGGLDFDVIGRRDLTQAARPEFSRSLISVFSRHSWVLGNKWPNTDTEDLTAFAFELEEALQEIEQATPEGDILLFMYCGSVEVADVLEHVLIQHPRVRAVVNLFWSYNFDITNAKYQAQWLSLLKRLTQKPGRVRITHSTPQIVAQFREVCGIEIPVLPHPSTTFGDRFAEKLAGEPVRTLSSDRKPRILFPGGARLEKGYLLAAEACADLAGKESYELCLRARLDGAPVPILKAVEGLEASGGVDLDREDYGEKAFVDWLASADIIVIPYLPEAFSDRTSGMLVDAMLLGIPVVVVKNTWLADELSKSGAGIAADANRKALVKAIEEVIRDYPAKAEATREAARQYLANARWSTLLGAIVSVSESALPTRPLFGFQISSDTGSGGFGVPEDLWAVSPQALEEKSHIIVYDDPALVLAWLIAVEGDWRQALDYWQAQARQALGIFYRNRGRIQLAERGELARHREGLPKAWQQRPEKITPLLLLTARGLLQHEAATMSLVAELESCGLGAGQVISAETGQAAVEEYHALRHALVAERTARRSEGDARMEKAQAQNALLEEQLSQLQAVCEQYSAQASSQQERAGGLEEERDHLRAEIDRIYHSKSWKVTGPLRGVRRALGAKGE